MRFTERGPQAPPAPHPQVSTTTSDMWNLRALGVQQEPARAEGPILQIKPVELL